jgi:hypothetical protein
MSYRDQDACWNCLNVVIYVDGTNDILKCFCSIHESGVSDISPCGICEHHEREKENEM